MYLPHHNTIQPTSQRTLKASWCNTFLSLINILSSWLLQFVSPKGSVANLWCYWQEVELYRNEVSEEEVRTQGCTLEGGVGAPGLVPSFASLCFVVTMATWYFLHRPKQQCQFTADQKCSQNKRFFLSNRLSQVYCHSDRKVSNTTNALCFRNILSLEKRLIDALPSSKAPASKWLCSCFVSRAIAAFRIKFKEMKPFSSRKRTEY